LLVETAELGVEFARLGWTRRLVKLREFYAAVMAGQQSASGWSPELVRSVRRVMGMGPEGLPESLHCPRCPPKTDGSWGGARTTMHLDDRWAMECASCGAEWVVFEARRTGAAHHS